MAGADAIYATNKNRRFATKYNIGTDFKRKGRAGKQEEQRRQMAASIQKERATRLEGSFGKEKEHYYLKKKGQDQGNRYPMDILRHTCRQHPGNRQAHGIRTAESGLTEKSQGEIMGYPAPTGIENDI